MTKATRECLLKIRDILLAAGWNREPDPLPTPEEAAKADWEALEGDWRAIGFKGQEPTA